jgi:hypothetical protein
MFQRNEQRLAPSSNQITDASGVALIMVALGLVAAILVLHSPDDARLTPEQISQMPLWGP